MTWPADPGSEGGRPGPLADLRVLDFSAFLPGPYCAQLLADLGADVIKVEPPGGEAARALGTDLYAVANRNKRGIVADLKDPGARRACQSLAAEADVVIEGFRPGVAARLGIGYDELAACNPRLIHCSISGFGQKGPARDKPGHDLTFLAVTGALSFPAHWAGPPRRSGVPIADLAAASYATIAILAALRERDRTGVGASLDVAIADATLAFASLRGGRRLEVRGSDRPGLYPTNDVYAAADGRMLAVAAVEEKFWRRLRAELRSDVPGMDDPRFDDEHGRQQHGDDLQALLVEAFSRHDAEHWIRRFREVDVPVELVVDLPEAVRAPQVRARGVVAECGEDRQVVFPVLRDGEVLGRFRSVAPALGQHTDEVLGELAR